VVYGIWIVVGAPGGGDIMGSILQTAVLVNLGFFVFNMFPIPPLDGSRVIYALAPEFVRSGMRFIEQFGIIFVFAIILLAGSVIGSVMSELIGFFLQAFSNIFRI